MQVSVKRNCGNALGEQQKEIRELVLAGFCQIQEGKFEDFNAVCDRLEEELLNATVQNSNNRIS